MDLGFEKRTILSGIAMHFNPEDIIGKRTEAQAVAFAAINARLDDYGVTLLHGITGSGRRNNARFESRGEFRVVGTI